MLQSLGTQTWPRLRAQATSEQLLLEGLRDSHGVSRALSWVGSGLSPSNSGLWGSSEMSRRNQAFGGAGGRQRSPGGPERGGLWRDVLLVPESPREVDGGVEDSKNLVQGGRPERGLEHRGDPRPGGRVRKWAVLRGPGAGGASIPELLIC